MGSSTVRAFLELGARVDIENTQHKTAMGQARKAGHTRLLKLLEAHSPEQQRQPAAPTPGNR